MTTTILADWDLVCAVMHHSGVATNVLTQQAHLAVATLGDGYGRMTADQLKQLGLVWDWSHMRDSSDEAQAAVAREIRRRIGADGLRKVELAVAAAGRTTRPA